MRLSLLSYGLGKSWTLDEMIDIARRRGFAGLDFRCEYGNAHGVEIERSAQERRAIRDKIQDAYLEAACVRSGARFDSPDPAQRTKAEDNAIRHIELAHDIASPMVRVCGNDLHPGVDRDITLAGIAQSLQRLADEAASVGIELLLEMHGEINNWHFALEILRLADRPNLGLHYNSDHRDLVGGSIASTYQRIRPYLRHIDLHDLASDFPYDELMALLRADSYSGYLCPETLVDVPSKEDYVALYANLVRAYWGAPPARTVPGDGPV
ncbi:MAG: sugar phosphate isomerase/epimerase family protein [Microbacterium sp.]|uniref:sugar phosphate isomerase/epimerase family protein n=1 Tax=Microbacterium sp. TaxID=51671 RepID=UPI0039E37FF7